MIIILLSGGSGKRLWPLSNSTMSKQFLKILPNKESMIQRVYRQITQRDYRVLITAPKEQHELIRLQIGDKAEIVEEPCRSGSYNAIKLACEYLDKDLLGNEDVCVVPVDIYVDDDFFNILEDINDSIIGSGKAITLVGTKPSYPSTKYGYIVPKENGYRFFEKPAENDAQKYIEQGALWNAGIFGFKLSLFDVLDDGTEQDNVSFDCKVCENTESISVVSYGGKWKDIGTWDTLSEEIEPSYGSAVQAECVNSTVINTLDRPLVALGLEDIVVAATHDGILVSKKSDSHKIKEYIKDSRPFFEEKRWGEYRVIDCGDGFLTKRLCINKGKSISYQTHKHRKEIWTIVKGQGIVTINDSDMLVQPGDTVMIEVGDKHKIYANEDLIMIETQIGDILEESDIVRF